MNAATAKTCRPFWVGFGVVALIVGILLDGVWAAVAIVAGAILLVGAAVGCPVCRIRGVSSCRPSQGDA